MENVFYCMFYWYSIMKYIHVLYFFLFEIIKKKFMNSLLFCVYFKGLLFVVVSPREICSGMTDYSRLNLFFVEIYLSFGENH